MKSLENFDFLNDVFPKMSNIFGSVHNFGRSDNDII